MAITRATLRIQQQLRTDLLAVTDQQVRDLVKAWATAWDEVSVDLDLALRELAAAADGKRITRAMVMRSERAARALTAIQQQLQTLTREAGVRITADLDGIVTRAEELQQQVIASQLPFEDLAQIAAWSRVDPKQLAAIVRRSTQRITASTRPLSADAMNALRRELIRGVAAGSNPNDVARQILTRCEGRFNGGLQRATTIARTEVLDAHRDATLASRLANTDVLAGWRWHAQLSTRTCPACWAQDGILHPVDEPGPIDHQCGRCDALPETKSWADLGLAGDEPRSIKPDARTTFIALSDGEQRRILGPSRWAAWKAGDYPMSAWSTRRTTDGWRDSIGVSPAPQSGRRRGSSAALAS